MKIKLWDKGYVKTIEDKLGCMYFEINKNRTNRVNAVTSIAAISRGKDKSNNPEKRYQHLLKEAAPNYDFFQLLNFEEEEVKLEKTAGRPLEFCPVVLTVYEMIDDYETGYPQTEMRIPLKNNEIKIMNVTDFSNKIGEFSYICEEIPGVLSVYTNARTLINAGIKEEDIPFNRSTELLDYFIAEIKVPYFVFAQMRTHGLLSQVAVSERVVDVEEYWFPEDLVDRVSKSNLPIKAVLQGAKDKEEAKARLENMFLNGISVNAGKGILERLGYKKEIYNRFPSFLKYKTFIIGGWLNNPYQWGHFLLEREAFDKLLQSWVQDQTKETAKALKQLIINYLQNMQLSIKVDTKNNKIDYTSLKGEVNVRKQ